MTEVITTPKYPKLLVVSLSTVAVALALSLPLHCSKEAIVWGGASALDGIFMGLSMALITRTKKIPLIYCGMLLILFSLVLFVQITDVDLGNTVIVPQGWPSLRSIYLDPLRWLLYCLCMIYPFARFGHHDSDLIS